MSPSSPTHHSAARSHGLAPDLPVHGTKRRALSGSMGAGVLCALVSLANTMLVAPTDASATPFGLALCTRERHRHSRGHGLRR